MVQQIDTNILLWFNSILGVSPALDMIFFFLAEYLIYLMPLGYIAAFARSKSSTKEWLVLAICVASGIVAVLLLNQLIGFYFFRNRPFIGHQIFYYASPGLLAKSFPSDHTTVAFLMASALLYSKHRLWGWLLMVTAFLVGIARIVIGVHYPADILAGALLGVLFGFIVSTIYKKIISNNRR
jgi:undecaprenyl-diphosphatase